MEKEQWKDEILNSLQNLQPAEPNPFLFTRIETHLQQSTGLSKLQVRLAGAFMVVLIILNVWMAGGVSPDANNANSLTTTYRY